MQVVNYKSINPRLLPSLVRIENRRSLTEVGFRENRIMQEDMRNG